MRPNIHFVSVFAFSLLASLTGSALAQPARPAKPATAPAAPSGTAVAVIPATLAKSPGNERTLVAGQDVFGGDTIATSEEGTAQIIFRDNTRLVVGPDSSVVIDQFVFNADKSVSGATLNFTKGAFRFITGKGSKSDAFTLLTPTASVGIRGTQFDIAVGSQGTAVIVFRGAVEVCHRSSKECATLRRSCSAAIATADGKLNVPGRNSPRDGLVSAAFPLARDQSALRKDFRVFTGGCGLGGGMRANGGGSAAKGGGFGGRPGGGQTGGPNGNRGQN